MDDTISRQAAIEALTENKEMINAVLDSLTLDYNTRRYQEQRGGQINEDIETIKELPSAQQEIIRCKDCKYSYAMITSKSKYGQERWARFCDNHKNWYPKDDWFCADGERKEE